MHQNFKFLPDKLPTTLLANNQKPGPGIVFMLPKVTQNLTNYYYAQPLQR